MGHINGILLEMLFRLSYSTRNPLYGHPAVTVIFSIIGLVAIGYSQWFSIQLRKSQKDFAEENKTNEIEMQTVVSIDKAKAKELAEEKKKGEKYALRLEFIWWFIVGFSIASSFIIPLSILLSSEVVPRWVGMLPFPACLGIIIFYFIGICLLFPFRNSASWWVFIIVGVGLYASLNSGGGYIGGLLIALVFPVSFLQLQEELNRLSYLWPASLIGGILFVVWLLIYTGVYTIGYTPLFGQLVGRNPESFLWPVVVFMGLFLVVTHIRDIILWYSGTSKGGSDSRTSGSTSGSNYNGEKRTFKNVMKRLFSIEKTLPNSEVVVCLMFTLILGVAFTILRSTQDFAARVQPNPDAVELKVFTYNMFQAATYDDGRTNLDKIVTILKNEDPDVVNLQESDSIHLYTLNYDSINYIANGVYYNSFQGHRGNQVTGYGSGCLTKFNMLNISSEILPYNDSMTLTRPLSEYNIVFRGVTIKIMNVHMEFDPSGSLLQAHYIADKLRNSTGPLILTGDFNVEPDSIEYAVILSSGVRNAYFDSHNGTFDRTYTDGKTIDYLWYRELIVTGARVLQNESLHVSDHYPVVATFRLLN